MKVETMFEDVVRQGTVNVEKIKKLAFDAIKKVFEREK